MSNVKWILPKTGSKAIHPVQGNLEEDTYPQLATTVYIEGNCFRNGAIAMFALAGCSLAPSIDLAEIVCFLGGEDVDPSFYGEEPLRETYFNTARDHHERRVFNEAVEKGKTIVGLCRGMQFIHVMNGGKLWQDVRGHAGTPHHIVDCETDERVLASSLHHQMCRQFEGCVPIAYSVESAVYYRCQGQQHKDPDHNDLEAAIYPKTRSIGFQGHPEIGGFEDYTRWCMTKIESYMEALDDLDDKNSSTNFEQGAL